MKRKPLQVGVLGFAGRMGQEIASLLTDDRFSDRFALGAIPKRGDSLETLFKDDVIVDFSSPEAARALIREARRRKSQVPIVIGSTGWSPAELRDLETAAQEVPILRSANFSVGIQICRMTLLAWKSYPELRDWRITIRDVHHAKKKDAPSGTALALQEALGQPVEIASVREGDIVGIHEISFESASEKISLIHEAKSRAVFAEGALEAAYRLAKLPPEKRAKRLLALDDLYLHRSA